MGVFSGLPSGRVGVRMHIVNDDFTNLEMVRYGVYPPLAELLQYCLPWETAKGRPGRVDTLYYRTRRGFKRISEELGKAYSEDRRLSACIFDGRLILSLALSAREP